tara:strand:- start:135 stop:599 length:465 start_codon:yes stop_codon:yes gene_type:complete
MASTISAATLTVTTTESITLNGSNMGATNTLSISSINEINQRIIAVTHGAVRTLFEFGATTGAGTFVAADVKYIRLTNKDDGVLIEINLETASSNCWVGLTAGQSLVLSTANTLLEADDDTTIAAPTLQNLTKISANVAPVGGVVDLDCYIASA